MRFLLIKNLKIQVIPRLTWLSNNANRIVEIKAIRYNGTNTGKMVVRLKDDSYFHASFWSFRSLVAWLFHSEFEGIPLFVYGLDKDEETGADMRGFLKPSAVVSAGSPEHWDILTQFLSA
jgi:hypothetical protein